MTEIHMPRLSDTMEEGVISTWHKQVGDQINRGDVVAEIETDKAVMEMEAYDDGVLEKILVGEGETVPIGVPIGLMGDGSGAAAAAGPSESDAQESSTGSGEAGASADSAAAEAAPRPAAASPAESGAEPHGRPKASPLARAVAREKGVDLSTVTGTGPGGRIIRVDIEAAAEAAGGAEQRRSQAPESRPAERSEAEQRDPELEEIPLSNIRKVTARRLTESKQQAPHFYLTSAVDVTDLVSFRADLNERLQASGGPKVSVNDLVVKACATALRANPSVNVSFRDEKLFQHKRVHLGVAVALDSGLVVPVIPDADRKSVSEIAAEGKEKAERARDGKLKPDEMSGSTFSVSNLGMFGIEEFSAVINPPEAAILAVGATREEVQVQDGEFVVRKMMRMTLSADHRAVDGAVGAVFMQQLTSLLQDPIRIIA
ncbi:pyruvate dehydrogenase E2 component (dihydrolipoamide acetyltransferase) [Actinopolyspora xinjiangensis]|uniref:Acetyltransferase component of pyruvate dehydrogenase complex n=1 Tax=Actinopolyspora xinjiangensis TaxID=405564 RepID=A0A1H0SMD4_9ACTN|nr:pyruvate dehydrogenase complex dihydrolipoamide acetyltransferase [Actinopolyspora xinjiangensis]SDP42408.1 pyruvate dehydrogenase E2 component (dihydrolipoamide acetyltransferase) [Actinopolyspora xinjiangensis]